MVIRVAGGDREEVGVIREETAVATGGERRAANLGTAAASREECEANRGVRWRVVIACRA